MNLLATLGHIKDISITISCLEIIVSAVCLIFHFFSIYRTIVSFSLLSLLVSLPGVETVLVSSTGVHKAPSSKPLLIFSRCLKDPPQISLLVGSSYSITGSSLPQSVSFDYDLLINLLKDKRPTTAHFLSHFV